MVPNPCNNVIKKSTTLSQQPTIYKKQIMQSSQILTRQQKFKNMIIQKLHYKSKNSTLSFSFTISSARLLAQCTKIYSLIAVMLFLLLFVLPQLSAAAELCHPGDKAALLAIKHSFSNPNPFPSWDPIFDCCDWYGVTCNETTNYVIGLDIAPYEDLNGTIPSALTDLKHLQNLRFHKTPNLVGEIPSSITKLPHLRYLVISWTNISGAVPSFLAQLKNLAYLDLSFNRLSGSIPPSLATLPFLFAIDLSRNQLTGPIPETFGHLSISAAIVLSHNKLSGEIPASLSNVNLSSVDISRNNLSGDASVFFGKGKITSTIDISRNSFEFDLSKVSFMESLDVLDISHNKIYGSIPQQITDAVFLQFLNVSYNRLCGKIPTGWKLRYRSESWDNSSFVHNRCLCGIPLDPCKSLPT